MPSHPLAQSEDGDDNIEIIERFSGPPDLAVRIGWDVEDVESCWREFNSSRKETKNDGGGGWNDFFELLRSRSTLLRPYPSSSLEDRPEGGGFEWPIFQMASYSIVSTSPLPSGVTHKGGMKMLRLSSPGVVNCCNVVIFLGGGEGLGDVLEGVVSVCTTEGKGKDGEDEVTFVEFKTRGYAIGAAREVDGLQFWKGKISARLFDVYKGEEDGGVEEEEDDDEEGVVSLDLAIEEAEEDEVDLSNVTSLSATSDFDYGGPLEIDDAEEKDGDEEDEKEDNEDVGAGCSSPPSSALSGLIDFDRAISEALKPLEKYSDPTTSMARRSNYRSQRAVASAAVSAMRGGIMVDKGEAGGGKWAREVGEIEQMVEDEIGNMDPGRVRDLEKELTALYGEAVRDGGEGNGVFGVEGTLGMVMKLMSKNEDDSDEHGSDGADTWEDERELWRRALQCERLRSSGLLRKVKGGQGNVRRVMVKAEGMRREVEEARRRFSDVGSRLRQIEEVRDSMDRRNRELEARLGMQRESIARLGRFQRSAETAEGRIGAMEGEVRGERGGRERAEGEVRALKEELEEWKRREKRVRRRLMEVEGDNEEGKEGEVGEGEGWFEGDGRIRAGRVEAEEEEARLKEVEANLDYSLGVVRKRREEVIRRSSQRGRSESAFCCVCLTGERQVLLLPCKHLCVCRECSMDDRMDKCPICRADIDERMVVYS